jgi:hypothetical protein
MAGNDVLAGDSIKPEDLEISNNREMANMI